MALSRDLDNVIVDNQTIQMKTFFYLCALLALFQAAASAATEGELLNYIRINSQIRGVLSNVSTFMYGVSHQAEQLAEDFHNNVTILSMIYGSETSRLFQLKYKAKAAEFSEHPVLNGACASYVRDLLKEDGEHQTELSKYLATAYQSWKTGIKNFYSKLVSTRAVLAKAEKEAYDCGILFSGNDPLAPYNCEIGILDKIQQVEAEEIHAIHNESESLIERHNSTLKELQESINDRSMPYFYHQDGIDGWMNTFCTENSYHIQRRA